MLADVVAGPVLLGPSLAVDWPSPVCSRPFSPMCFLLLAFWLSLAGRLFLALVLLAPLLVAPFGLGCCVLPAFCVVGELLLHSRRLSTAVVLVVVMQFVQDPLIFDPVNSVES